MVREIASPLSDTFSQRFFMSTQTRINLWCFFFLQCAIWLSSHPETDRGAEGHDDVKCSFFSSNLIGIIGVWFFALLISRWGRTFWRLQTVAQVWVPCAVVSEKPCCNLEAGLGRERATCRPSQYENGVSATILVSNRQDPSLSFNVV